MSAKYYDTSNYSPNEENIYDLDSPEFIPEIYLDKILKECALPKLMRKEEEVHDRIQTLDSEMQTLVYENYNKFISATDTIKKMKTDFCQMESEMESLTANMKNISKFSAQISSTLQDRREQINKLSSAHGLLKRLQFLFELPTKLQHCMETHDYFKAVKYYCQSQKVLQNYAHLESFHGIQADCEKLIEDIKNQLEKGMHEKELSSQDLAENIQLLLKLGKSEECLSHAFLVQATHQLSKHLDKLDDHLIDQSSSSFSDILEFVDCGCTNFLSELSMAAKLYSDMFIITQSENESDSIYNGRLKDFITNLLERFVVCVKKRALLEAERSHPDFKMLVRALDRLYRRLQANKRLIIGVDLSQTGIEAVESIAEVCCQKTLDGLKCFFDQSLIDLRQSLALSPLINEKSPSLKELLSTFISSLSDKVKVSLHHLQAFINPEITFSSKMRFQSCFCSQLVREETVVKFFKYITKTAEALSQQSGSDRVPSNLLLLLTRICLDLEKSSIHQLLSLVDEFPMSSTATSTPVSVLLDDMRNAAQIALNHYVSVQGHTISQMLRKSIETRDWLHTIEPRSVRPVMKRVIEDLNAMETQIGMLFEEGQRKERSSDSNRRTLSYSASRHGARSTLWSDQVEHSFFTNIQKLFSERIEIFSSVEFSKISILTGVVKISLKTLQECVRLRTFSKFGLQQIQVDAHYLQLYLWQFVADEKWVHSMLDEILGSAYHRCLDPVFMEQSVVDTICQRV